MGKHTTRSGTTFLITALIIAAAAAIVSAGAAKTLSAVNWHRSESRRLHTAATLASMKLDMLKREADTNFADLSSEIRTPFPAATAAGSSVSGYYIETEIGNEVTLYGTDSSLYGVSCKNALVSVYDSAESETPVYTLARPFYAPISSTANRQVDEGSGYVTLANGFTLQWGSFTAESDTASVSFPKQFPGAVAGVQLMQPISSGYNEGSQYNGESPTLPVWNTGLISVTTEEANFLIPEDAETGSPFYYIAIGW